MNYAANTYPFRQDSTFRYFAGHNLPDLALTIDGKSGESRLWGDDIDLDHIIWMGDQPSVAELAEQCGALYGGSRKQLAALLRKYAKEVHFLPPYRSERKVFLEATLGQEIVQAGPSIPLIKAVVALRSRKSAEEIEQMELAVSTSLRMHAAAQVHAAPGQPEAEVAGLIEGIAVSAGGRLAYPAIVTRNGHILHNHYHGNILQAGDLLLIDAGAEAPSGYAGDLTRTFTVGADPTPRQRAICEIVAKAKAESIAALQPGKPFRAIHDLAAGVLIDGLKALGLMQGDTEAAVAAGAHALFMPHGLGHLIGLDVHDMEDLGEDLVGYDDEITRSSQFGTRNLRLGRRLEAGFVVTIEPGLYFIPTLMDRWQAEKKHAAFINYAALDSFRQLGGVRFEDNVVITPDGHRVLGS